MDNEIYDIGIVGWWSNLNYGGCLTYYALKRTIESFGKSVLMIRKSGDENVGLDDNSIPIKFAQKEYCISSKYSLANMLRLNEICDTFVVGSDQLWNPHLQKYSGPEFFLSFVDHDKRKIAYATSFGNISRCKNDYIKKYYKYINRFDAISVREDYAVDILKNDFGCEGKHVCDPVFLCDINDYYRLSNRSKIKLPSKYVLRFFLDPDDSKLKLAKDIGANLRIKKYVNLTDLQNVRIKKEKFCGEKVLCNCEIEDFLAAFINAEYVVTDSFHGTCLAVIFNKPFVSLANYKRGEKRFISLLKWLHLEDRLILDINNASAIDKWVGQPDYEKTNLIISNTKKDCKAWLYKAISESIPHDRNNKNGLIRTEVDKLWSNADFKKIRILATLLKDYNVKHIVVSPGGRDVPLVRMFEYNDDIFKLHRVVDERSAAYFGMGLARQLKHPVACVCTSGTAVSNYLPAVTEAYYTGVPMILITADRYSVYHEQGEDQTIPQSNIFQGVIKKEITLPEGDNYKDLYQVRRDISDCILETTHNGNGPTHINIGIDSIKIGSRVPREYWKVMPKINPHILRVSYYDEYDKKIRWVNDLAKANKVLVVYGQNHPLNKKQIDAINCFTSRFNCVIATDFISNLKCDYSVSPYNMIRGISQERFNQELAPDIVVSVGGKRLMNDPLMYKLRSGKSGIRHWRVAEDGAIKDLYFKLSSVLEMSQDNFFEFFSKNSTTTNTGEYYKKWISIMSEYTYPEIKKFDGHYVQSKFIPAIPENSLLHLGVGQSFYDSRRYVLNDSVDVFCNMGTNGIDGCTSTFMGQCAIASDKLCFLLVGDLSFFYDMNSIWSKSLNDRIRILMVNNSGTDLLKGHNLRCITSEHNASAKGWVENCGFKYLTAKNVEEFEKILPYFLSDKCDKPLFFEVFCA